MSELLSYAGKHKYLSYAAIALSMVSAILSVVPFYYIWKIVDEVLTVMPDYSLAVNIVNYGWMAMGFTVLSIMIYVTGLMCSHLAAFRVARNMKKKLVSHSMDLPPGTFDTVGSGNIRRIIFDSTAATETYLAHNLPDKAGSMVLPIVLCVMLFYFDWKMGILCALPLMFPVLAFMTMMRGEKRKERMDLYQNSLGDMNKEAVEYVRGISVVKTFQQTMDTFTNFKKTIEDYGKHVLSFSKTSKVPMTVFYLSVNLVYLPMMLYVAYLSLGQPFDSALITDFIFYIVFTPIISVLMMKVMFASNENLIVDDALSRINYVLSLKPLPEPSEPKTPADSTVVFENVSFVYDGGETPAVKDFNITMKPGTITALVGPSGSGKSTVAGLLCRFWDPTAGEIKVGGVDIREIGSAKLSGIISGVFQNSRLIAGTISENVRMGRPDATDEMVLCALKAAQCNDIIDKMPDGVNTLIGTEGVFLSGGETQRIAIARAFIKDSPIVVLDEATAFADPENEHLVQKAFEELAKNKTVLLIAHRLTTVKNADQICVMEKGEVVEVGTHDELVGKGCSYGKMWKEYQTSLTWKIAEAV